MGNATCNKHYMWENNGWVDKGDEQVWDCIVLSKEPESQCAQDGQDCSESKCCASAGKQCFRKSEYWATCNETCNPKYVWENNGWVEKGEDMWECTLVSEESESACVADGQDCSSSKCCSNAGSTCFKKDDHWAICNATCNHNYKWENNGWAFQGDDEKVWACDVLSEVPTSEEGACVADSQNCSLSKCCSNPDSTCFQKNDEWASCNSTCDKHYKWENNGWVDKGSEQVWDCIVLSEEEESECAQDGQDCSQSKCCASEGKQCFRKSEFWATCNATCNPKYVWENNGWVEKDEDIWDCTLVSEESESVCAADGQNCSSSQCCSNAGSHCFKKNDHWSSCNATCNQHYMWENNGWADKGDEKVWDCEILSEEGDDDCAVDGQDCSKSKCCVSDGKKCFQKDEHWSTCNETCSHNYVWENNGWVDKGDQKIWDCTVLGH